MSRSWLFVPGDNAKMLAKAASIGADALVLDLEDAVAEPRKAAAREQVREYLGSTDRERCRHWVRVNALDSPHALHDLCSVMAGRPDGIVLPKAAHGADAERLAHYLDALETQNDAVPGETRIAMIAFETPAAVVDASSFRQLHARVAGITWGAEDMAGGIGAQANRDEHGEYTAPYVLARSLCLMAAAAAGVAALDTPFTDFRNEAGLRKSCREARRDGFVGKIAIHPSQVPIINDAFMPSADEIAHARAVVAAFERSPGAGAVSLNGRMLDAVHLVQAQRVLEVAAAQAGTAQ